MTGGRQAHLDAVAVHPLAVVESFGAAGELDAVAHCHDVQCRGRGQHHPVARAGVVGVAVSDHGAIHRPDRVDVEIAWRAVEPFRARVQQILGAHHPSPYGARSATPNLTKYSYCEFDVMTKT